MRWILILPLAVGCGGCSVADHWYFKKAEHEHAADWSYGGETGPEHWGDLDSRYRLAKVGRRQSPIDLESSRSVVRDLGPIEFHYLEESATFVNNGHTLEHEESPGSWIVVEGKRYDLLQFHFHAPSEHTIDGRKFDLELHLVHRSALGEIAVVGVLATADRAGDPIVTLPAQLPEPGTEADFHARVTPEVFLPEDRSYYYYPGSFTTPPCTEGVRWYIMRRQVHVAAVNIEKLRRLLGDNSRPVQPTHDRTVIVGGQ